MYDIAFIGSGVETKFNTIEIPPEDFVKLKGQIGDFVLTLRHSCPSDTISARSIVININPAETIPVSGAVSFSGGIEDISGQSCDTVVFIQDYEETTPAYFNSVGLRKAIDIREKYGKEVRYFYKSMRFPDGDSSLFLDARKAGIVFEKYMDAKLSITYEDGFNIYFKNVEYSYTLSTGLLFMAPVISPGETFQEIAKVVNIIDRKNGFLQCDNIYLQPTKTNKRGVYALGFSRGPGGMSTFDDDVLFTLSDIGNEISSLEPLTNSDREVDPEACALCYTCYRSCPHGAIERNEEKDCMKINRYACYGCDTCISACPAKAISIVRDEAVSDVRDYVASDIPGPVKEQSGKKYKILMCENSAEIAYKELGMILDDKAEVRSIPCSNSVKKADIYRELSDMESKVLVIGCINESCRHIDSNKRFELIVKETKKQLDELGLDSRRIGFERVSLRMKDKLKEILDGFTGDYSGEIQEGADK